MNYEDMTDAEINKAVTKAVEGGSFLSLGSVDFCNDWGFAGLIIQKEKISIEFRCNKSLSPVAKRFGSNTHNIADKNPLRAAMIVYLMMQEQK